MTEIEQHKQNLKNYIDSDPFFNDTYKPVTDFEIFCYNHCKDIEVILLEINKLNNVIDKLSDCLYFADELADYGNSPEQIKEYFMKENKDE